MEKLREYFDTVVVFKDLQKTNFLKDFKLPSFLRDWLLEKFEDENGNFNFTEMADFIREYLPEKNEWVALKDRIIMGNERVKFIAKISVDINIKTQEVSFSLPDFGLDYKQTLIEQTIWEEYKKDLVRGRETWGVVELGYRCPNEQLKIPGKITLVSFKNFCGYDDMGLDFYKDARAEFDIHEWLDVILGAMDYNASGYKDENQKLAMITRLLPFVEKRLNLIELAPKGTGKSYLFGRISKYGWLSSGGIMSRAKMFYDISSHMQGLVCNYDFIALDEVQTISFTDVDEMRAALKGYMESGVFTVGNYEGTADSGVVLLGNISQEKMDEYKNMFQELPPAFHESALLDRFHGFIKGWEIPRMHDDLKICGWALNSEYFCTVMHLLRDDASYRQIVDQLIDIPKASDTRDTEAIKRICTAFLKLLFPNVRSSQDINAGDFRRYCLHPASKMRAIIKTQLGILDTEFKGKAIPSLTIRDIQDEN